MIRIGKNSLGLMAILLVVGAGFAVGQDQEENEPAAQTEAAQDTALVNAYQREFVFLNNEIQILEERLGEVNSQGQQRVAAARRRLQALETELLQISARVDRRSEELRVVEEASLDIRDAGDSLRNVVNQGNNRLRENDRPTFAETVATDQLEDLSEGDRLAVELGYLFEESFNILEQRGAIRSETDAFFLEGGEQVDGQIVHVGQIAAMGVSDENAGTLAPAGGGRLRLVDQGSAAVARQAASAPEGIETLPVYVYESLDNLVETDRGGGLWDAVRGGGIIGLVIIGIGFAAVVLIVVRALTLAGIGSGDPELVDRAATAVQRRDFDGALKIVATAKGAANRVLTATIDGLRKDPESIEDVISESVLNEAPKIDRFRSAISVFAAVAPLLGLLGTVTGMIATFDVITQFGTGDPGLLSGGISEALITTEFGLIVAIPALLVGNLLSSWADRITSTLEISALRMVNAQSGGNTSGAA